MIYLICVKFYVGLSIKLYLFIFILIYLLETLQHLVRGMYSFGENIN